MIQAVSQVLEVDPRLGDDAAALTNPRQKFKTLTAALKQAQSGGLIRLMAGTYSAASGETFPLMVGNNILVSGDESGQGSGVKLEGNGPFQVSGQQEAVAVVLQDNSQLRGVTITNRDGGGVWIARGNPLLRASQILDCGRYGVSISATAFPNLLSLKISQIQGEGLLWQGQAKGVLRQSQVSRCQKGIAIADQAAPLIDDSRCSENTIGLWISGTASPVIRQSTLVQNQQVGLQVSAAARPDLGHPQDPGHNVFRYNRQQDIQNDSSQPLLSVGNDILPQRIRGEVQLASSQIPAAASLPPLLLTQTTPLPSPQPTTGADGASTPSPTLPSETVSTASRFRDMQGHWAAPFVEALAARNLVRGFADGTFRPDQWVKRSEFAALAVSSYASLPNQQEPVNFRDVAEGFWAKSVITQAQTKGLMGGFPDGTFRPDQSISRVQAIVAIANGLSLPSAGAAVLNIFHDRAQIPSYALSAIATATQHRLVVNHPDPLLLRPLEPITRAEVAALVYQGLVFQGQAPAIAAPAIVRPDTTLPTFTDIRGHWAEPFIIGLSQQQLVSGYADGSFQPDTRMTRAQYAALLHKTFQPKPQKAATDFVDVPADHWAADAIQAAYQGGFLSGFPDHTFNPDGALLRVQAWVSLVSGLEFPGPMATDSQILRQFPDAANIPAYAIAGTTQALQQRLIVTAPDAHYLRPNQTATRADMTAAVYQALVALNRLPALESPYIVSAA